ncbi:hypothetical protein ACRRTK_005635 [Alexandromys fortis]
MIIVTPRSYRSIISTDIKTLFMEKHIHPENIEKLTRPLLHSLWKLVQKRR